MISGRLFWMDLRGDDINANVHVCVFRVLLLKLRRLPHAESLHRISLQFETVVNRKKANPHQI